jgi:hypothetical protein
MYTEVAKTIISKIDVASFVAGLTFDQLMTVYALAETFGIDVALGMVYMQIA